MHFVQNPLDSRLRRITSDLPACGLSRVASFLINDEEESLMERSHYNAHLTIISNFKSKVRQGGDEQTTKTVQKVRLGACEEANAASPMNWNSNMRIITLNFNGIRSAYNKGFLEWFGKQDADILCVQELKAQAGDMTPDMFSPLGYHGYFHYAEKKGYSGVAIYSKRKPDNVIVRPSTPTAR